MTATMNEAEVSCPKCGGQMWDNRLSKKNPKAPDYKCRSRACDGVIWPPRGNGQQSHAAPKPRAQGVDLGRTGVAELDADMEAEEQRFVEQVRGAETQAAAGTERLKRLFAVQEACFNHALLLAAKAEQNGIPVSLEGVSALTAQALIAFKEGR